MFISKIKTQFFLKKMENTKFYCNLCKKKLQTKISYQSHLNSKLHLQNVDRVDEGNILKLNNYKNYLETLPTDIKVKKYLMIIHIRNIKKFLIVKMNMYMHQMEDIYLAILMNLTK